jgi:hypothetical protein
MVFFDPFQNQERDYCRYIAQSCYLIGGVLSQNGLNNIDIVPTAFKLLFADDLIDAVVGTGLCFFRFY